jgi:hypothetical protein
VTIARAITKPSTAECDLDTYTWFLIAEPKYGGCCRLAEYFESLSHDSVNRFLLRERYEPKDLFDEVKLDINLIGGTSRCDDTVVEKPYSDPDKTELIGYFWSGKWSCGASEEVCDGESLPKNFQKRKGKVLHHLSQE